MIMSRSTSSEYPADWGTRRRMVYRRDGYTCQNCGAEGGPYGDVELHAHHIVPKSQGGSHSLNNLTTLCYSCHNAVHDHHIPRQTSRRVTPVSSDGDSETETTSIDVDDDETDETDEVEVSWAEAVKSLAFLGAALGLLMAWTLAWFYLAYVGHEFLAALVFFGPAILVLFVDEPE